MRAVFRLCTLVALLLVVPSLAYAQRQMRVAFVTATDGRGGPVLDLATPDFQVLENDVKKPVTFAGLVNFPMRIVLLVDTSSEIAKFQNQLRAALLAFIGAIPEKHEIALATTGRQFRPLQAPTLDRAKLKKSAETIFVDNGGTVLLDAIRESESRWQKKEGVHWPVYVIITTDGNEVSANMQNDEFTRMQADILARGTSVHALALQTLGPTLSTQVALGLAQNSGGLNEILSSGNPLPDKMTAIAARIMEDYNRLANRYQIEYTSDAKFKGSVDVGILRENVKPSMSLKR